MGLIIKLNNMNFEKTIGFADYPYQSSDLLSALYFFGGTEASGVTQATFMDKSHNANNAVLEIAAPSTIAQEDSNIDIYERYISFPDTSSNVHLKFYPRLKINNNFADLSILENGIYKNKLTVIAVARDNSKNITPHPILTNYYSDDLSKNRGIYITTRQIYAANGVSKVLLFEKIKTDNNFQILIFQIGVFNDNGSEKTKMIVSQDIKNEGIRQLAEGVVDCVPDMTGDFIIGSQLKNLSHNSNVDLAMMGIYYDNDLSDKQIQDTTAYIRKYYSKYPLGEGIDID